MNRPAPLYMRVTGDSWARLADPIRCLHGTTSITHAHGRLRIEHGRHPVARLLARALRLPRPHTSAVARLTISAGSKGEVWERAFGDTRLRTVQRGSAGELIERFGVVEFRFRLDTSQGGLLYMQHQAAFVCWRVRLPIPAACAPRVEAREDPAGAQRIQLDVRVMLPVIGSLISYAGVIEVKETQP